MERAGQAIRAANRLFSAVWLIEKESPFKSHSKQSEFRNNVIHNGHIPSRRESEAFGTWALSIIYDILEALKPKHERSMTAHHFHYGKRVERVGDLLKKNKELANLPDGGGKIPSVFGIDHGQEIFHRQTFAELLAKIRESRAFGINPNTPAASVQFRSVSVVI